MNPWGGDGERRRMIGEIIAASGPMPDPEAHGRYLEMLKAAELSDRLACLNARGGKYGGVRSPENAPRR